MYNCPKLVAKTKLSQKLIGAINQVEKQHGLKTAGTAGTNQT